MCSESSSDLATARPHDRRVTLRPLPKSLSLEELTGTWQFDSFLETHVIIEEGRIDDDWN